MPTTRAPAYDSPLPLLLRTYYTAAPSEITVKSPDDTDASFYSTAS